MVDVVSHKSQHCIVEHDRSVLRTHRAFLTHGEGRISELYCPLPIQLKRVLAGPTWIQVM